MNQNAINSVGSSGFRSTASAVFRTAAVTYGLTISAAVLFWTLFASQSEFVWFAPLAVLLIAGVPFAAGAVVYAGLREALSRRGVSVDRPAIVWALLFASLGIGPAAISPFVSNPFLPYSFFGAINGALVASFVAILARTGHIHHDPE